MTEGNRRSNIADEVARSEQALDAAKALLDHLPSSHNRLLGGLQRARELADYDAAVQFSADDAQGQLDDARAFRDDALAFLRAEGWVS